MSASQANVYDDASQRWQLIEGDALALLAKLPEHSIDCVVTDPPYGIALGGESWDRFAGGKRGASETFECWTRAWATEARRVLKPGGHLLAFGAPRTFHRLTAGIEEAGLEIRDTVLWLNHQGFPKSRRLPGGRGIGLKPAYEPILLAREPLAGTTSQTLARFGAGALGIEAARVGEQRFWPANIVYSHAPDCPAATIDRESLGPSRLFFCAKASRAEREAGCGQLPPRASQIYTGKRRSRRVRRNTHPTVKPLALARWLIRLDVPEGGVVLDPFAGSGSTGIAAVLEGRHFVGIEREGEYVDIACARLHHWAKETSP